MVPEEKAISIHLNMVKPTLHHTPAVGEMSGE